MYRFYVDEGAAGGEEIALTGEDYNHIRNVLRMRAGEKITVCDGAGTDYICELSDLAKDCVKARVVSKEASQPSALS